MVSLSKSISFFVGGVVLCAMVSMATATMAGSIAMAPIGDGGTWNIYVQAENLATWADAQADIAATTDTFLGTGTQAQALEARNETEFFVATRLAAASQQGYTWLGASDLATDGTWTWASDGTAFYDEATGAVGGWTNYWRAGEPNGGTSENAALMTGADIVDTSENDLRSYWYVFKTGQSQITSELTAPTYKMIVDPNTGRYYELITDWVNFHAAKMIAESHVYNGVQGRLAVINDESENSFAAACANGNSVAIGLTDDPMYGGTEAGTDPVNGWVWTGPDGATPLSSTGYSTWALDPDQPDNSGIGENYVALWRSQFGQWNDYSLADGTYALVEFGQEQEVAKAFYHKKISGAIGNAYTNTDTIRLVNGLTPATSEPVTSQTATYNFVDIKGQNLNSNGYIRGQLGDTAFPGDNVAVDDDSFAMKSYVTVEITEAGTYTFGGYHDDVLTLAIDRGAQEAANVTVPVWPGYTGIDPSWGLGAVAVTFDSPGTYNIYCVYGEKAGSAGAELAVAKGDYSTASATTYEELLAAYDSFTANATLIGDTLNGGLATKNLRQVYTQNGFTVNASAANTLNLSSNSTTDSGSFGGDQVVAAGTAVTATTQLVVPENSGGWWTLGVGQSQEGSLTITQDGQPVTFSQVTGHDNGAVVNGSGAMVWNAPDAGMISGQAFGAVYLEPGTYDIAIDYNPNNEVRTISNLQVGTFEVYNAIPVSVNLTNFVDTVNLMMDVQANGAANTLASSYTVEAYSTINFQEEADTEGHFGGDTYFPIYPTGQDNADSSSYGVLATTEITVDQNSTGYWSFCINSDDGFGMRIVDSYGNPIAFEDFGGQVSDMGDATIFGYDGGRAPTDSLAYLNLAEGTYTLELVHWDDSGDAALELSYAQGQYLTFDSELFHLLGGYDVAEQLELFAAAGVHTEFGVAFDLLGDAINFEDQSEYTGEASKIAGDANGDGKVDGSDVTILAGNWQRGVTGTADATWEMGDFNGDGKVDGSDVTILAGNWQYGVSASSASVPEPGMLMLLLAGITTLLAIRRRK